MTLLSLHPDHILRSQAAETLDEPLGPLFEPSQLQGSPSKWAQRGGFYPTNDPWDLDNSLDGRQHKFNSLRRSRSDRSIAILLKNCVRFFCRKVFYVCAADWEHKVFAPSNKFKNKCSKWRSNRKTQFTVWCSPKVPPLSSHSWELVINVITKSFCNTWPYPFQSGLTPSLLQSN